MDQLSLVLYSFLLFFLSLFFFFSFHRSFDETGIRAGGEEILKITLVGVLSLIVKVT